MTDKITLNIVQNTLPPVTLPAGMTLGPLVPKYVEGDPRLFREVRSNVANEDRLLSLWRDNKRDFLLRGFCVHQNNSTWYLTQWLRPHGSIYTLSPIGQERLNKFLNPPMDLGPIVLPEPEFGPLPAGLERKLYDYQIQPARQVFRAIAHGKAEWGYPGAADLSSMGTGKTYVDMAAALSTGRKIAVLCPSVGQEGWKKAFAHYEAEPYFIGTYEAVRGGFREAIAAETDTGDFKWKNSQNIILILDEAQALRHDTLTTRCCAGAIRQGIPIIVASATIATSPLEMRFAGRITGLHQGDKDWDYFRAKHGCYLLRKGGEWKWDGKTNSLEKIHRQLFPRRGCRMRKEDLGEQCPETEISLLPIDVAEGSKIQQDWIRAMQTIANLKKQGKSTVALERTLRMAIWQASELALVPHIAQRVRRDVTEGFSVALFCSFSKTRMEFGRLLGTSAGFFGGQSASSRQYYEKEFQANRQHILINNIKAGGASVSLHDLHGRRRRAYIFPTDFIIAMVQATGRIDRVGGVSKSEQFIPYVAGGMSERMVNSTRVKMRRINTINDGEDAAEDLF